MIGRSIRIGALTALALSAAVGSAVAASPSFDCDKAKTPVERAICADDGLAELDLAMARAFATALARAPSHAVNELKDAQASWKRTLNECGKAGDLRGCVVTTYQSRMNQL